MWNGRGQVIDNVAVPGGNGLRRNEVGAVIMIESDCRGEPCRDIHGRDHGNSREDGVADDLR